MSDYTTEFDPGLDEESEPVPLVQVYELAAGYWAATLSVGGDPDAPNLSGQIKTRHILAVDAASLEPQIIACLVADFGMMQEEAEELQPVFLAAGEPPVAPEPEPEPEPPVEPEEPPPEVQPSREA